MTTRGATRGAYVIGGVGASLYLAARTTGAGWLVVLMCGLVGILLVATLWPRPALARVRVTARGPRDATVDEPFDLELRVERAGLGVRLRPLEPDGEWTAVPGTGATITRVIPERRGVIAEVAVEVSSAAPFGLIWWRRKVSAPVTTPIEVAPRRADVPVPGVRDGHAQGEATAISRSGGDRVRTLRDYLPGDPMRLVHWPATARRGEVIVKELEQPEQPRVVVVLDLRGDTRSGEEAAQRAMGIVCGALESGMSVDLHTHEETGPVAGSVSSPREAGRRLARATAGAPSEPRDGERAIRVGAPGARR
jgi:uncharacterized protein (DUF58 family)